MKCMHWNQADKANQLQLLQRPVASKTDSLQQQCMAIINEVRSQGDAALYAYTEKFDGVKLSSINLDLTKVQRTDLDKNLAAALRLAYQTLHQYHQAQLPNNLTITTAPGVTCQRQARAIRRVGLYVPGGSAPLVSTVLMLGVPAQIAGCPLRILATPPNAKGQIDPAILFAAELCGIEQIITVGGAQAIAALAYGTESVAKVDKLFGPGNAWVTQAKTLVAQDPAGASCDLPAGPSEVLIIADHTANPEFIAADLLAQAEHGCDSQVLLITSSDELAQQVNVALQQQLTSLPRRDIAIQALAHSTIIITTDLSQAIAISNDYAPEHLILNVADAEKWLPLIECAGAVFVGPWTPETLGDYVTGANHVLPTYGYARSISGLSVTDFMTFINIQTATKLGIQTIGPAAELLAQVEGLQAHERAVSVRLAALLDPVIKSRDDDANNTIIRSDLLNFAAYRATANREQLGNIWLNANESPYPMTLSLNNIQLNRYPHRWPQSLLQQLADYYGVQPQQLLLSRGSDEAIDLLIRLCCQAKQDSVIISPPTFHIYSVYAALQGAEVLSIPLDITADFALPVDDILARWQPNIKLVFICSPNNPTGNVMAADNIIRICNALKNKALVVLDEAYQEFSALPSMISQVNSLSNLVILRTLSKGFGLAGVRCGVTIADEALIQWLRTISSPYPLPSPCIAAIHEALLPQNLAIMQQHLQEIKQARESVFQQLSASPMIKKIWPSQANFLLLQTTNAAQFIQHCLTHGIIVRDYSKEYGLANCVRITIGTASENDALLTAISKY